MSRSICSGVADATEVDVEAYRNDIAAVVAEIRGRPLQDLNLVELLNQLTAISVRHGVPLPPAFVMVGKALAQVDGAVSELAPELDLIEEARRFFLRSISRRLAGRLDPQQIIYEVERLRYRASQVSDGLATVVGGRPGRQLEVKFTSARLEQKVVRAGRAVALGLGAGLDLGCRDAGKRIRPDRPPALAGTAKRRRRALGLVRGRGRRGPASAGAGGVPTTHPSAGPSPSPRVEGRTVSLASAIVALSRLQIRMNARREAL